MSWSMAGLYGLFSALGIVVGFALVFLVIAGHVTLFKILTGRDRENATAPFAISIAIFWLFVILTVAWRIFA